MKIKRLRNIKSNMNIWTAGSLIFIVLILLPNLSILIEFFSEPNENWYHIQEYLLMDIIQNSLLIIVFTALLTILIGTSLAWLVSAYDFPLKSFLTWGLILPLAIPPYIGAYTYHGILNYTGIIQTTLRQTFQIDVNQQYFDIMNIPGAIFIFTVFLYPYVYTITRAFLSKQAASLIENARLLGRGSFEIFWTIVLPISRAAMIGGVSLVILEVLNDYGVVKYFGIQTFTTAIFQTWFGMGDIDSAIKLSGTLMIVVLTILLLERFFRGRKRFSYTTSRVMPLKPTKLTGKKAFLASAYALLIFALGFLIPFIQLVDWMLLTFDTIASPQFLGYVWNSLLVAMISAGVIVTVSLVIANFTRLYRGVLSTFVSKVTVLGYSIPGAVIAIGVIILFIALDRQLSGLLPIVLSTSLIMLIFAYVVRFLAIGYQSIEAGFEKVGNRFTEASRTLGVGLIRTFFKVDVKLIRTAIFGGFILSFIDILKELPLTLILRPFNFDTLATRAFQYANDEMIHEASLASILIIVVSGLAIFVFQKILEEDVT